MYRVVAMLLLLLLVFGCQDESAHDQQVDQPAAAKPLSTDAGKKNLEGELAKARRENEELKRKLAHQQLEAIRSENAKLREQVETRDKPVANDGTQETGSARRFTSLAGLGQGILDAFRERDAEALLALYPSRQDLKQEKERLLGLAEDPLVKEKIEGYFRGTLQQWDTTRQAILEKSDALLNKLAPAEYQVISNGGFVGLAPLQISEGGLAAPLGLDPEKVSVKRVGSAILYLQVAGQFYALELDDLMFINDSWFLSGDFFAFSGQPLRLNAKDDEVQQLLEVSHPEAVRVYHLIHQQHAEYVIVTATEEIARNEGEAVAYQQRGQAYIKIGENDKAIADLTRAIQLENNRSSAYRDRGDVFSIQGQLEKAIVDYTEAIRHNAEDATAYTSRGHAWFLL